MVLYLLSSSHPQNDMQNMKLWHHLRVVNMDMLEPHVWSVLPIEPKKMNYKAILVTEPLKVSLLLWSLLACEGRDFSQDLFLVVCVMSSFKLLTWHNLEQSGKWISMKNYQVGRWACRWWADVLIMAMGVGKTQPKSGQHHSVDLGTGLFLQGESKLSVNSMRVFTPFCSWLWLRQAASAPCCPDLPAMTDRNLGLWAKMNMVSPVLILLGYFIMSTEIKLEHLKN